MQGRRQTGSQRGNMPRLEWRTFKTVEQNFVKADINTAEGKHGALYSIRFSRSENGRDSGFFRPDDLVDIGEVAKAAQRVLLEAKNGR